MNLTRNHMLAGVALVLVVLLTVYFLRSGSLSSVENFEDFNEKPGLVLFHANWCGHCKKLMPEWKKLQDQYPEHVTSVEADAHPKVIEAHGVQGFPTIKYLKSGLSNAGDSVEYEGERTKDDLEAFLKQHM